MKTLALTSTIISLSAVTLFGQTQSDIEFLRARADAHERKISQLEQELIRLKAYHTDKPAASTASKEKPAPAATASAGSYVVKSGDVLTRIAYRHKTSVAAIMKENSLSNDHIYVGQKLRIPGLSAPAVAPETSRPAKMASKPAAVPAARVMAEKHTVKSGETIYSIARQHRVTISSLMAANPDVKPTRMHVGQTLRIDANAEAKAASASVSRSADKPKQRVAESPAKSAPKSSEVARKAPAKKESTPAPKSSAEPAIRTITVNQQMTYGQFANRYGASTTQLNALNGLSLGKNTMLAKGSELYVPKF